MLHNKYRPLRPIARLWLSCRLAGPGLLSNWSLFSTKQIHTSIAEVNRHASEVVALPPSSVFASYVVGLPPSSAQLNYANRFFENASPSFLSSAAKFRTLPVSDIPEVAFLGRSNVGKSSLLNALLHRSKSKVAHVSKKPGRTKLMNAFGVNGVKEIQGEPLRWQGKGGLVVMDMPGYGKGSHEEWGREIVKYLLNRKQLRRTFVLIDSEHGVKDGDLQLLRVLWHNFIPYQVIMSKVDKVLVPIATASSHAKVEYKDQSLSKLPQVFEEARTRAQRRDAARDTPLSDVITCSSQVDTPPGSGKKIGIEHLRWSVLCAVGLDCDAEGIKHLL